MIILKKGEIQKKKNYLRYNAGKTYFPYSYC